MPDYITTYGGTHFYPTMPEEKDLSITDIAHALSLLCRGNGHVRTFWSVGEHCICCAKEAAARGYSNRVILACLLHDASESYMSDVPRPFKKTLPQYMEQEEKLIDLVYQHFLGSTLTEAEALLVKEIDDDMLYFDLKILLNEPSGKPAPDIHIELTYEVRAFSKVEAEYLEIFRKYKMDDIPG